MNKGKIRMLAISLASFTVISGLAAYFTSEDNVTNAFKSATLQIKVVEPNWKPDPTIVPEQKIDKDPSIVNIDDTPAYVFMEVTVPADEVTVEKVDGENKGELNSTQNVPMFRFINSDTTDNYTSDQFSTAQKVNAGWYAMSGYPKANKDSSEETVSYTYLYAYTGTNNDDTMVALNPNETTLNPLFKQVLFCNAREDDSISASRLNIKIKAYGIQEKYLKSSNETETKAELVWQYLSK
ncbi:MAG: hypothetical protein IJ642_00805 [Oscillospiraceae bacterium]|nr:hypothetical protein [Oscillospiraceae bacterium]